MTELCVGKIVGKTSTTEFKFLVTSKVKKWDYVKVKHSEQGYILGQVVDLEKENSKMTAECYIIGYRTDRGFLRQPRTPLEPDSEVFEADDFLIKTTLGLKKEGLYLGLLEGKPSVKVFLEGEKLLTKHIAILAKSGAGKSYVSGVLLEELADKNYPVIVIDPHGEYSSLKYPNKETEDSKYLETYGIKSQGFGNKVKEYALNTTINPHATQLRLPMPSEAFELVESMPFKLSNTQKGLLYSAVNEFREASSGFSFDDIRAQLEMQEGNAKWGVINALDNLEKTNLFSLSPTAVSELIAPGKISIINLKGANPELQEIAVNSLAINLFEQRKLENIPPFYFVIEESHSFCPERGFGEARSSKIIRGIASEGRKFGLGLCIISQRSARVDKNVLSQCTSQIILNITNPNDLKAVSSSFEGVGTETEKEIKALPVGKALIIGAADYPTFVDIRVRKTEHGGRSKVSIGSGVEVETKQANDTVFAFKPRIMKKDIVLMEDKEVKNAKLVLVPCLLVNVQKDDNKFVLVFDLNKFQVFTFDAEMGVFKVPIGLLKLSPMQKKVLNQLSSVEKSTAAELLLKTGLTFGEINGIVSSLSRLKLIDVHNKDVVLNRNLRNLVDLSKLNFLAKAEYVNLPGARLENNILERDILKFVKELGLDITNSKEAWMPFYQVRFEDDSEVIKDALSFKLEYV